MGEDSIVVCISRKSVRRLLLLGLAGLVLAVAAGLPSTAQKAQEEFSDKFKIADDAGGVSVATSSDGRYVFVAGKKGVIVSDDYGKTGSWVQTVRMK